MTKYIIHAANKRMWYVNGYLIPSMLKQGIKEDQIELCLDVGLGNLETTMNCFKVCGDAWHIQDDVVICEDFYTRTRDRPKLITAGFVYEKFGPDVGMIGRVEIRELWYSFPCIYIPGDLAKECAEWFYTSAIYNNRFTGFVKLKINDDGMFREFLLERHRDLEAENLNPCLVDHIDYLIGGSLVGLEENPKKRPAAYWYDDTPNKKLIQWLKER